VRWIAGVGQVILLEMQDWALEPGGRNCQWIDCMFRLNRELKKMKKPMVKYQEKIKSWTGVRSPITQKPWWELRLLVPLSVTDFPACAQRVQGCFRGALPHPGTQV